MIFGIRKALEAGG